MSITYTNPRMSADVADWPTGSKRTVAMFRVETHPQRGERLVRTTLHPKTLVPNAPKKVTYAERVRIVDGDDGRIYIIELTAYTFICVRQGTLLGHETVFPDKPRYRELAPLVGLTSEEIERICARYAAGVRSPASS